MKLKQKKAELQKLKSREVDNSPVEQEMLTAIKTILTSHFWNPRSGSIRADDLQYMLQEPTMGFAKPEFKEYLSKNNWLDFLDAQAEILTCMHTTDQQKRKRVRMANNEHFEANDKKAQKDQEKWVPKLQQFLKDSHGAAMLASEFIDYVNDGTNKQIVLTRQSMVLATRRWKDYFSCTKDPDRKDDWLLSLKGGIEKAKELPTYLYGRAGNKNKKPQTPKAIRKHEQKMKSRKPKVFKLNLFNLKAMASNNPKRPVKILGKKSRR